MCDCSEEELAYMTFRWTGDEQLMKMNIADHRALNNSLTHSQKKPVFDATQFVDANVWYVKKLIFNPINQSWLPIVVGVTVFAMALFLARGTVIASRRIFERTLQHVLHNPMSFFDRTPTGRILSRLGKDIDVIDNMLPVILRSWMTCLFSVWYSHITTHYCISNELWQLLWINITSLTCRAILATDIDIPLPLFSLFSCFSSHLNLLWSLLWHFARSILVTFYYNGK